jgi:hypothetical protein
MNFQFYAYYYFWIAPHLLLLPVAVLMFRKGLHKEFPIFFSYLLFEFVEFAVLFSLHIVFYQVLHYVVPSPTYKAVDLISRTGSIALHFGILQELFESPVAHSSELRRTHARMLKAVSGVLIVLALLFIGSLYYSTAGHRLVREYGTVESMNIAQCGLIVFVFLWYRYLGLKMTPFVFGIVVGTGITACFEPLIHAWKDSLAFRNSILPDDLAMAAYHLTVIVWLYFAYAQKKITSTGDDAPAMPLRKWAADSGRIVRL